MRQLLLLLIIALCFTSCTDTHPKKIEDAFILSMQKNDFKLLNDFLPDRKFYDAVSQRMPSRTDKEINEFLDKTHEKIKQAWQNTIYTAADKKIDLNKVVIRESIFYDPFPNDEASEGLIINYEYKGSSWDDLQFIVSRKTGKLILLDIPNPTRAFSMQDKDLRATAEAKAWIEMNKPEFKKNIEELSNKIIQASKTKDLDALGKHLVYRGNDETRYWRTAININDSTERKYASQLMEGFNRAMENCNNYKTGNFVTLRQPEGLWIKWPLDCGNRIITLHYLSVNGELLLADISSEMK